MQTFIIPLILAIITALITNQVEINRIISYAIYLLAITGMIYGFIWVVRSIINAIKCAKRSDLEDFIVRLQGVIDIMFIFKDNMENVNDVPVS